MLSDQTIEVDAAYNWNLLHSLFNVVVSANLAHRRRGVGELFGWGERFFKADASGDHPWRDIEAILQTGQADCKSICAWRAADLRLLGFRVIPEINQLPSDPGFEDYHITLKYRKAGGHRLWYREDPTAILISTQKGDRLSR